MNYLSYQLRSKKEIFTYLKEKEIEPEDRVKIVQRLEELRLLDDAILVKVTYGQLCEPVIKDHEMWHNN